MTTLEIRLWLLAFLATIVLGGIAIGQGIQTSRESRQTSRRARDDFYRDMHALVAGLKQTGQLPNTYVDRGSLHTDAPAANAPSGFMQIFPSPAPKVEIKPDDAEPA